MKTSDATIEVINLDYNHDVDSGNYLVRTQSPYYYNNIDRAITSDYYGFASGINGFHNTLTLLLQKSGYR